MRTTDIVELPTRPYKKDLFGLLGADFVAEFTWEGHYYILRGIMRESGCGSSFNVEVFDERNERWTLFIRTAD